MGSQCNPTQWVYYCNTKLLCNTKIIPSLRAYIGINIIICVEGAMPRAQRETNDNKTELFPVFSHSAAP